jgi:two-component system LytT family response regulator
MKTIRNILIGGRQQISPREIILLTADNNYTQVHFSNGQKVTVATCLKVLEKRFSICPEFFRTHKSYLINLSFIKKLGVSDHEPFVQMQNDYRVLVSRRKKNAFFRKVNSFDSVIGY